MGLTTQSAMDYAKTTYLATSLPPKSHREHHILRQSSRGDVWQTTIPKKSMLEAHLLLLPNATWLVLSFRHDMSTVEASGIIDAVCASLAVKR